MLISTIKLKQIRNSKGWSQDVLAKASGLSLRTIQRIENQGHASAESVLAIASVLEISPSEFQSTNDEIQANITRRVIVKGLIALIFIAGGVFLMMAMNANIADFFDSAVTVYFVLCVAGLTLMSFGTEGLRKSVIGLKYIFASDIVGGQPAKYLVYIYDKQIVFSYASAFAFLAIGFISIVEQAVSVDGLHLGSLAGSTVVIVCFLYSIVLSEFVLRPLKNKLESADMSVG